MEAKYHLMCSLQEDKGDEGNSTSSLVDLGPIEQKVAIKSNVLTLRFL